MLLPASTEKLSILRIWLSIKFVTVHWFIGHNHSFDRLLTSRIYTVRHLHTRNILLLRARFRRRPLHLRLLPLLLLNIRLLLPHGMVSPLKSQQIVM